MNNIIINNIINNIIINNIINNNIINNIINDTINGSTPCEPKPVVHNPTQTAANATRSTERR